MAKCVRIENGMVTELLPFSFEERGYWLGGNTGLMEELAEAPDFVQPNWRFKDGEFFPPEPMGDADEGEDIMELMDIILGVSE